MVSFPLSYQRDKIRVPTRKEWSLMFERTSIVITLIVCVTILGLATVGSVVFLVYTKNDSSVIQTLVTAVLGVITGVFASRMGQVQRGVDEIKKQGQVSTDA